MVRALRVLLSLFLLLVRDRRHALLPLAMQLAVSSGSRSIALNHRRTPTTMRRYLPQMIEALASGLLNAVAPAEGGRVDLNSEIWLPPLLVSSDSRPFSKESA